MVDPNLIGYLPDLHAPYHDQRALDVWLTTMADVQPARVEIIGDFLDCLAPARWSIGSKLQYDKTLMPREIEKGIEILDQIRGALPFTEIGYTQGNHEDRYLNSIRNFVPWAEDLVPTIGQLLLFEKFEIAQRGKAYKVHRTVTQIHGKKLSTHAAQSAYKERMRHGQSIVQGHCHRLGLGWDTADRERFWFELGWLGDVNKASYLEFPGVANWQQGFGFLYVDRDHVHPLPVKILGKKAYFNGKLYVA